MAVDRVKGDVGNEANYGTRRRGGAEEDAEKEFSVFWMFLAGSLRRSKPESAKGAETRLGWRSEETRVG